MAVKHFQNIYKKKIGRNYAPLFTSWADTEIRLGNCKKAIEVLQQGIVCKAEPVHLLLSKLQEARLVDGRKKQSAEEDDDEVVIKVCANFFKIHFDL